MTQDEIANLAYLKDHVAQDIKKTSFEDIATAISKMVEASGAQEEDIEENVETADRDKPIEVWAMEKILEGNVGMKQERRTVLEVLVLEAMEPILQRWAEENMSGIMRAYIDDNRKIILSK